MVILRLTLKTRKRLGKNTNDRLIDEGTGTTVLGDWYVNLIRCGREQLILYTSSTTLLSVVCPAKSLSKNIRSQLCHELEHLLIDIGVDELAVKKEMTEMKLAVYAKTVGRRTLGSMTDFAFMIQHFREWQPEKDLRKISRGLAGIPCRLQGASMFPEQLVIDLLGGRLKKTRGFPPY